jgi:hypothetical protein
MSENIETSQKNNDAPKILFKNNADNSTFVGELDEKMTLNGLVFANMKEDIIIKKNDYTTYVANAHLSEELLLNEFNEKNPKISIAKQILIPRICDDLNYVSFCSDNNLFKTADAVIVLLNILVCFNESIDMKIFDFLFEKFKPIFFIDHALYTIFHFLKEDNFSVSTIKLLDWYYNNEISLFEIMIRSLLSKYDAIEVFNYVIKKGPSVFERNDHNLLIIFFKSTTIDNIEKILSHFDNIPYNLLVRSVLNDEQKFFKYIDNCNNYKCDKVYDIIDSHSNGCFKITKYLLEHCNIATLSEDDNMSIIALLHKVNDIKLFELITNTFQINYGAKNNMLIKYLLSDEKYDQIKVLLSNKEKYGDYSDFFQLSNVKRMIDLLDDERITELIHCYNQK